MTTPTSQDVTAALAAASEIVHVVGVVAFDVDWEKVTEEWKRNDRHPDVIVRAESDNVLYTRSFVSDTAAAKKRTTFTQMQVPRDHALELNDLLVRAGWDEKDVGKSRRIELLHLDSPLSVAQVDDRFFIQLTVLGYESAIEEVTSKHPLWGAAHQTLGYALEADGGQKYAAPLGTELLEIFDHKDTPRGIFPRDSFYDTDYAQLVVWVLILDRQGRLLIHRRADNAKDNRGMWDKSVGGHVEPHEATDTSRAAVREVIEELFSNETDTSDPGFQAFEAKDSEPLYLGQWRPGVRGRHVFKEASRYRKEWYYFKMENSPRVYTPREMPDGSVRRLRVRVEAYMFVAGEILTDDFLTTLENSVYQLVPINELKSVMDKALAGNAVDGFDATNEVPKFTPDLVNIMTGGLRDELQEFAELVSRHATDG
ncbi:hypothetical protein BH11ACT4_BH11ACT4_13160 [soil metagenome]